MSVKNLNKAMATYFWYVSLLFLSLEGKITEVRGLNITFRQLFEIAILSHHIIIDLARLSLFLLINLFCLHPDKHSMPWMQNV